MVVNDAEIELDLDDSSEYDDVLEELKNLFSTVTGTYPMNRDFGIDTDIMDCPVPAAETMLSVEYYEKVAEYIPQLEVTDVSFSYDDDGNVTPYVTLEPADDEDEDDEDEDELEDVEDGEDDE
jgi:hypothetical protein